MALLNFEKISEADGAAILKCTDAYLKLWQDEYFSISSHFLDLALDFARRSSTASLHDKYRWLATKLSAYSKPLSRAKEACKRLSLGHRGDLQDRLVAVLSEVLPPETNFSGLGLEQARQLCDAVVSCNISVLPELFDCLVEELKRNASATPLNFAVKPPEIFAPAEPLPFFRSSLLDPEAFVKENKARLQKQEREFILRREKIRRIISVGIQPRFAKAVLPDNPCWFLREGLLRKNDEPLSVGWLRQIGFTRLRAQELVDWLQDARIAPALQKFLILEWLVCLPGSAPASSALSTGISQLLQFNGQHTSAGLAALFAGSPFQLLPNTVIVRAQPSAEGVGVTASAGNRLLFHGTCARQATSLIQNGIDCTLGQGQLGLAFYLTPQLSVAMRYAIATANAPGQPTDVPVILCFEVPENESFLGRKLEQASFWALVRDIYERRGPRRFSYAAHVEGPIVGNVDACMTIEGQTQVAVRAQESCDLLHAHLVRLVAVSQGLAELLIQ
eukprot:TRINITY_DN5417_c0_g1_i2.p2 TRINITY_DN5417_c0_g1~~TRINITY_DN5417_c0_g1_i2.p2  ORF type:complete len:504 (-),score=88.47 TRINITY_DN5417_c0_g1_i2:194-1705(-)